MKKLIAITTLLIICITNADNPPDGKDCSCIKDGDPLSSQKKINGTEIKEASNALISSTYIKPGNNFCPDGKGGFFPSSIYEDVYGDIFSSDYQPIEVQKQKRPSGCEDCPACPPLEKNVGEPSRRRDRFEITDRQENDYCPPTIPQGNDDGDIFV